MRVALDTNVLACAEGVNERVRQLDALALLGRLARETIVLPVQVLGELFNVLIREGGFSASESRAAVEAWRKSVSLVATTTEVMEGATLLACDHRFRIWDAVILAAAAEGGCRLLWSEDMLDGFTWGGVTIANPFAATRHPVLADYCPTSIRVCTQ
jgi:predicted nucleic acid-binding protein